MARGPILSLPRISCRRWSLMQTSTATSRFAERSPRCAVSRAVQQTWQNLPAIIISKTCGFSQGHLWRLAHFVKLISRDFPARRRAWSPSEFAFRTYCSCSVLHPISCQLSGTSYLTRISVGRNSHFKSAKDWCISLDLSLSSCLPELPSRPLLRWRNSQLHSTAVYFTYKASSSCALKRCNGAPTADCWFDPTACASSKSCPRTVRPQHCVSCVFQPSTGTPSAGIGIRMRRMFIFWALNANHGSSIVDIPICSLSAMISIDMFFFITLRTGPIPFVE